VVHYARLRVKIFQSLPIPDEQAEADLTRCNRHYSTKAEAYTITVYALAIPAFVIIILGVLALCLWELVVLFHLEQYQLICTLVAMLALLSVDKKIVDRLKNRPSIATITTIEMSLIVVAALCGAALITISRNEIPGSLFAELAGLSLLQGALAFTTAVIAFLIATIAYEYTEVRIRTHYFPDMGIVMELQVLCALSQLGDARWADLAQKRELLQRLEAVAYFSERGLPRRLQTGDAATDEWHHEQAKQIAAAFRDLKRLVINPVPDSRALFTTRIMASYCYALKGEWGLLDRSKPQTLSRPQYVARLVSTVKTLVVGALPFSCIVLVQQTSMAIQGSAANYVKTGAILWALVTYVSLLDSNYASKLSVVKDLATFIPSMGKKETDSKQ
jgi:hypothetical protein